MTGPAVDLDRHQAHDRLVDGFLGPEVIKDGAPSCLRTGTVWNIDLC